MTIQQLTLHKNGHRYVFRFPPGKEPEVCVAFAESAVNPSLDFDWYNAAVLSYKAGQLVENRKGPSCLAST